MHKWSARGSLALVLIVASVGCSNGGTNAARNSRTKESASTTESASTGTSTGTPPTRTNDRLSEADKHHAITQQQFDAVQVGTSRQALLDQLGAPTNEQGLLQHGWIRAGEFAGICTGASPSMVPYFALTTSYDAVWYGFCLDGDSVKWKSMYSWGD